MKLFPDRFFGFRSEEWYRQQIKNNLKYLSENTRNLADITTLLFRDDCLSIAERQRIFKQEDGYEQNYFFYNLVLSKGNGCPFSKPKKSGEIRKVLQVLYETDNAECAQVIQKRIRRSESSSNKTQVLPEIRNKERALKIFDVSSDEAFYLGSQGRGHLLRLEIDLSGLNPGFLKSFTLNGVELNAPDLLYILGQCPNLQKIHLWSILVFGEFEGRVNLPFLREFKFHEVKDHNCYHYQMKKYLNRERLQSILMFAEFPEGDELDLGDLYALGVDILVAFEEWKALEIVHGDQGQVLVNLEYFRVGDLADLGRIALRECTLTKSWLPLICKGLTYLNLHDVNVTQTDLTWILRGSSRLLNFYFWPKFQLKPGRKALVPFDLPLEILPKSLKSLSLRMTNLILPSGLDLTEIDLDSLTLDKCNYPERLETHFHRVFRARKVVIIGFSFRAPNARLLGSLLKMQGGFDQICLESYTNSRSPLQLAGEESSPKKKWSLDLGFLNKRNPEQIRIQKILSQMGIAENEESFIITNGDGGLRGKALFDEKEINSIWDNSFDYGKFCV